MENQKKNWVLMTSENVNPQEPNNIAYRLIQILLAGSIIALSGGIASWSGIIVTLLLVVFREIIFWEGTEHGRYKTMKLQHEDGSVKVEVHDEFVTIVHNDNVVEVNMVNWLKTTTGWKDLEEVLKQTMADDDKVILTCNKEQYMYPVSRLFVAGGHAPDVEGLHPDIDTDT